MKKILMLLIVLGFATVMLAQEKTVNNSKTTFKNGVTYVEYTAAAADTLKETNQDTIDFVFNNYNHEAIGKIWFSASLDSLAGNDSIYYSLTGYNQIGGTGTSLITGGILVNQLNELVEISKYYSVAGDTTGGAPMDLSFRHYTWRFIQAANNSFDGGAEFNWIKGKLFYK